MSERGRRRGRGTGDAWVVGLHLVDELDLDLAQKLICKTSSFARKPHGRISF